MASSAIKTIQQLEFEKWGNDPVIKQNREQFALKELSFSEFEKELVSDYSLVFNTEKLAPNRQKYLDMVYENSYRIKYDAIKGQSGADKEEVAFLQKRLENDNLSALQKKVEAFKPESKSTSEIEKFVSEEKDFPDMVNYLCYMRSYKLNGASDEVISAQQAKIDVETCFVTGERVNLACAYTVYLHMFDEWMGLKEPKGSNGNYTIEFNGSRVQVPLNVFGVRFTKTMFGSFEGALTNEMSIGDFNIRDILASFPKDCDGKNKIDFCLDKFGRQELLGLFSVYGMFIFIKQSIEVVTPLTAEEMFGNKYRNSVYDLNNEHIACYISVPTLAVQIKPKLDLLDTYIDERDKTNPKVYRLYATNKEFTKTIELDSKVHYVNCICPSTNREFLLPCGENTSAKDAVASLMMVPKGLIPYIQNFARQGEIFAVTWKDLDVESDEFKKLLDTELVAMNGDDYFDKMVFES